MPLYQWKFSRLGNDLENDKFDYFLKMKMHQIKKFFKFKQ